MRENFKSLSKQLILDLRTIPSMGREDYYVSKSNEEAVKWVDKWPEWLTFGFVVVGPSGAGKSHLANVLKYFSRGILIKNSDIRDKNIMELSDNSCLILEDIDTNLSEINLLHLFNFLLENNSKIMITSKIPIKKLNIALADLRSRLLSLPQVNLGLPDDKLISRVIIKQFIDKGVKVDMEVVNYLLKRVDRSFSSINNIVSTVNMASIQSSRKITVPFVRKLLSLK